MNSSPSNEELQRKIDFLMRENEKHHRPSSRSSLKWLVTMIAVFAIALGTSALAAVTYFTDSNVPSTIPYEGYLEKGGVPVNGTVELEVKLYTHPTNTESGLLNGLI